MFSFIKNPKLRKLFVHISAAAYICTDVAKNTLLKEQPATKHVMAYIDNFYSPILCLLISTAVFFIKGEVVSFLQLFSGIAIGGLEFLLSSEVVTLNTTVLFTKFCESFSIILLFMLSEILSGRMKRLEFNLSAVLISSATLSVFVFMEIREYSLSMAMVFVVLVISAFLVVDKHLIYASQGMSPLMIASNVKIGIFFILVFCCPADLLKSKNMVYRIWDEHRFKFCMSIALQTLLTFTEYICLRSIDLDNLMLAKILSTQGIFIYKKLIEGRT